MQGKIGIIGANGNMGLKRIQALKHSMGEAFCNERLVLCDLKKDRLAPLNLPVKFTTDSRDVLNDPTISAVILSPQNGAFRDQMLIDALKAKKHVLVEKPIAMNERVIEEAFELAAKHRLCLKTAYNLDFFPSILKLKSEMSRLGKLNLIHCLYGNGWFNPLQDVQGWVRDPNLEAGVEYFMGCHMLSLLWAIGGDQKITSKSVQTSHSRFPEITDTAVISIQTDRMLFSAIVSWVQWKNTFQFNVLGSDGIAQISSLVKYMKYGQSGEELRLVERQKGLPKEQSFLFTYDNVDGVSADLEFLDVEMKDWMDHLESFDLTRERAKNLFIHRAFEK